MKNLLPIRLLDSDDPTQTIAADDYITYDGAIFSLLENRDVSLDRYLLSINLDEDSGLFFARYSDDSEEVLTGFMTLDDVVFTGRGKCGDVGKRGYRGSPALDGRSGRTGQVGCVGVRGDRGLKGLTGDTGIPGEAGDKGLSGLNGELGEKGYKGFKGDMGANGAKGEIGVSGFPGNRGIAGPKGNKGYTGRVGPEGCAGELGEVGVQGKQGDAGELGEGGEPGTEIANGVQGPDGRDGNDSAVSTITAGKNMVVSLVRDTEYQISAKCEGCVPITLPPDCSTTTTTPPGGGGGGNNVTCNQIVSYTGTSPTTFTVSVGANQGNLTLEYAISGTGAAMISMETGQETAIMPRYARESGTLTLNKTTNLPTILVRILLPTFSPAPTLPVQVQFKVSCVGGSGGYIECFDNVTFGFGTFTFYNNTGAGQACCYDVDWGGYIGLVALKATNVDRPHQFTYWENGIQRTEANSTATMGGIAFGVTSNGRVCITVWGDAKATFTFTKSGGGTTTTTVNPPTPTQVGTVSIRGLTNCAETRDTVPNNAVPFHFPETGRYKIVYNSGAIYVNATDPATLWRAAQVVYSDVLPNRQFLLPECSGSTEQEASAQATQAAATSFTLVDVTAGMHYFWVADINCPDNWDSIISFVIWKMF